MLKVTADGKHGAYELSLFTSISEVTPSYLTCVTKDIHVADNYVLVALLCREKLTNAIIAMKQNKPANTPTIPVFVKAGHTTNDFIESIKTCDKLVVAPSDIAMGNHINAAYNEFSFNNVMSKFDGDGSAFQRIANQIKTDNAPEEVYFIEFKLIPAVNIKGYYRVEHTDYVVPKYITEIEY